MKDPANSETSQHEVLEGMKLIGEMRRSLSQSLDQVFGLGFRPETVIDVGVAKGTFELYEKFPEARHLLIEPIREYEGVIKDIAEKYGADYLIAAASDQRGTITINVHPDLICSSLFKETEGTHVDGKTREVPAVRLDDVCEKKGLKGPYLIKIDVQGAELKVLDGAPRVLGETELVILEVSLFRFYVGGPQFYDVMVYMKERGFVAYDIFGGHTRSLDGALAQVDMSFVREDGLFRKHHFYATPEQREKITKWLMTFNPDGS
jgi:FkbM family methyltransferase